MRECTSCIVWGKSCMPKPGPLQPLPLSAGPWQKISLDIAGEFKATPHHQRFLIVAIDQYSKWPEIAAYSTVTSSSVIEFLTSLFCRFGLVESITTDNGVQFVYAEFQEFLKSLRIRHCRCALIAPQSNGAVERLNRVIEDGLKAAIAEGKPFMTAVRQVLTACRMTPHGTTNLCPTDMMFSYKVRTPLSMLKAEPTIPATKSDVVKRVQFRQKQRL